MANCDIIFKIGNKIYTLEKSGISSEAADYKAVAECIILHPEVAAALKSMLMDLSSNEIIEPDETQMNNGIVGDLAQTYPDLDWSSIDPNILLLMVRLCYLNGLDIANKRIIRTINGTPTEMFVILSSNKAAVTRLRNYLHLRSIISKFLLGKSETDLSEEDYNSIEESFKSSGIDEAIKRIEVLKKQAIKSYTELVRNTEAKKKSKKEKTEEGTEPEVTADNLIKTFTKEIESIPSGKNLTRESLLQHYLENSSLYDRLIMGNHSVAEVLNELCTNLLKEDVNTSTFLDIFARQFSAQVKWDNKRNPHISTSTFVQLITAKYYLLQSSLESMPSTEKNKSQIEEMKVAIAAIQKFLAKNEKDALTQNDYLNMFEVIKKYTDEDFGYTCGSVKYGEIKLNNAILTYKGRYEKHLISPFLIDSKHVPRFVETYKGCNIYELNGFYYFSEGVLTGQEYETRTVDANACKRKIDKRVNRTPISKNSLMGINLRGNNRVVWLSLRLNPGYVIKSFDSRAFINENSKLVWQEDVQMAYWSNKYDNTTTYSLSAFYEFIINKTRLNLDTSEGVKAAESLRSKLTKYVDTSLKAVCLLYAINQIEGYRSNRGKATVALITQIIDDYFSNPSYEYFLVEDSNYGSTPLYTNYKEDGVNQKSYRTVVLKIQEGLNAEQEIFSLYNSNAVRQTPSIAALNTLATSISLRFGIGINVLSESDLEEYTASERIKIPSDAKGFVHNGLIFVVSSRASCDDVFHEFTHIILGVLKSKNYENYLILMDFIANTKRGQLLKKKIKPLYEGFADQDLNEEVFARIFGEYLFELGDSEDLVTARVMQETSAAVGEQLRGIFGTSAIKLDRASLNDVLHAFGTTISEMAKEGNGLELSTDSATEYRQVTNWIAELIRAYEKSVSEGSKKDNNEITDAPIIVGIKEEC